MLDKITLGRPYAKAIFEYARDMKKLAAWSNYLILLSSVVIDPAGLAFINNPASSVAQREELLLAVLKPYLANEDKDYVSNFIHVLARNKRLQLLPEIASLYEALRKEEEKTVTIYVKSFATLSKPQEEGLIASLSKRLSAEVTLSVVVDKNLLGGAIIYAGDLVIDASVRGKLDKLRSALLA